MNWQDEGFLLSKTKFRENANIINVFTSKYGKMSGIVYGGNSRKIRNYLQLSNKIFIFHNIKNTNKIGYFKTELVDPISPKYFNNNKKTSALLSIASILNILLPESQPYKNIYKSLNDLLKNFDRNDWIILYLFWELNLIKELGFGLNFDDLKNHINRDKELSNVEIDGSSYQLPNFLILKELPNNFSHNILRQSLSFLRSLMLNKFFTPSNLIFPKPRILLENYFN